jgi:hypothetical protein
MSKEVSRAIFINQYSKMKNNSNPIETVGGMYFDLKQSKDLLMQVTERPTFNNVFTPGEQTSIGEMIQQIEFKLEFLKQIQLGL